MRWFAYASVLVLFASPAAATVLEGKPVRVPIEGRLELAIGVRPHDGVWQLPLQTKRLGQPLTRIELVDQTSPMHEKWVVGVQGNTLRFDAERFVPTHAYRVTLYSHTTAIEHHVVYLYEDRTPKPAHVEFTTRDLLEADLEMRVTPKGSL